MNSKNKLNETKNKILHNEYKRKKKRIKIFKIITSK